MNRFALQQCTPDHASSSRLQRSALEILSEFRREAVAGSPIVDTPFLPGDGGHVRLAEAGRRLSQRVEYRLQIEGRAADDLQHLGGRGLLLRGGRLLLQRLVELAGAQVELLSQGGSGRSATAHGGQRSAPFALCALAAARPGSFAIGSIAPYHGFLFPQGLEDRAHCSLKGTTLRRQFDPRTIFSDIMRRSVAASESVWA